MSSTRSTPSPTPRAARSLVALQALCELGLHPEVLVPAFLEALHSVVPSSRNLFDWTDEQGRLVRYFSRGPSTRRSHSCTSTSSTTAARPR
jgi:hypothetical protein